MCIHVCSGGAKKFLLGGQFKSTKLLKEELGFC